MFATPVKSRSGAFEPKTAPPKQVSFSLYANSHSGRLSPVKQMRMMPPLDTMNEEQDGSFRSDNDQPQEEMAQELIAEEDNEEDVGAESQQEDSSEDIVIVEELEQEAEQSPEVTESEAVANDSVQNDASNNIEDAENIPPASSSTSSTPMARQTRAVAPKEPNVAAASSVVLVLSRA